MIINGKNNNLNIFKLDVCNNSVCIKLLKSSVFNKLFTYKKTNITKNIEIIII